MTAEPVPVQDGPVPNIAYLVIDPEGGVKQVFGPLDTNEAMKILKGGFSAHAGPPDMGFMAILRVEPQAGPLNKVMAKVRPDATFLGTVIVTGTDGTNLTSLDPRDEDSLKKIAEG